MGDIANLVLRRIATAVLVLFMVLTFLFFFMRYAGDPLAAILPEDASAELIAQLRELHGFNRPIHVQYFEYIGGVVRGDFGTSLRYNLPAFGLVVERLPATMRLAGIAIVLAVVISVPVGIYSALKPGSVIDMISRVIAVAGQSVPVFWLAILTIMLFAVRLGWLPAGGVGTWRHMILPAGTLAAYSVPLTMRLVRSSMIDIMSQEYIKTARAKGLSKRTVLLQHAFRNAMIPVITVVALRFGFLIAGAIVLEEVFAYPGLGRLAIHSMLLRDYSVVQAFVFLVCAMVIVVNLIVDILYGIVDPRVRVK